MPWTFCTKADVISIHPTNEAALADLWSDAVEDMIRQYLGTPFLGQNIPVVGELHNGDRSTYLMVNNPPVVSVEQVIINGTQLTPTDYQVTTHGIELKREVFPEGYLNAQIDYTSGGGGLDANGQPTVSPIIRLCAAAMIVSVLTFRGRAGADSSLKWGNTPVKEGGETVTIDMGMADHLSRLMKRMLRRDKLRIR